MLIKSQEMPKGKGPRKRGPFLLKYVELFAFLLPALSLLFVFRIYPFIQAFLTSLHQIWGTKSKYIGIHNYISIFTDPLIIESFKITLIFSALINPIQVILALILAISIARPIRGQAIFKVIFFVPVVIPMAVASTVWMKMLDPNFGLVNGILKSVGLPPQPFLTSPKQALGCIIAMATWKGVGYWMIFFLAGIKAIPATLLESALVDGANHFQRFWFVTLPLLKRPLTFVLAADTAVNFLLFAPIYMMTRGGPAGSTNLLIYEAYKTAFVYLDWGRASALAIVIAILSLLIIFIEMRALQARHEY